MPVIGLFYQPWMIGDDYVVIGGMDELQGKPMLLKKICSSVTLSTTDPTRLDGGTDSLSYGRAYTYHKQYLSFGAVA
jgi:hypothetical protein